MGHVSLSYADKANTQSLELLTWDLKVLGSICDQRGSLEIVTSNNKNIRILTITSSDSISVMEPWYRNRRYPQVSMDISLFPILHDPNQRVASDRYGLCHLTYVDKANIQKLYLIFYNIAKLR